VAVEELTEEEKRRWRAQEEAELVMDRLMNEERAQEEADARVSVMKARLEAMRRQREAKRAKAS
jgi:zinc finger protein 830